MPPHPAQTSPLTRTEQKRQAILDAALLEFDAGGFLATSMDQIAARANVSKRTVYNHFRSKEELFEVIRSELFTQMAGLACEYDPQTSLHDQLAAIGHQHVDLLCSDAFLTFARISIPLSLRCPKYAKATYAEFQASNKAILRWMKAATEDGRLDVPDAKFAVQQFVGLLKAGILWPQLLGGQPAPSKGQRRKIVDATVSMFLSQYGVATGAE